MIRACSRLKKLNFGSRPGRITFEQEVRFRGDPAAKAEVVVLAGNVSRREASARRVREARRQRRSLPSVVIDPASNYVMSG